MYVHQALRALIRTALFRRYSYYRFLPSHRGTGTNRRAEKSRSNTSRSPCRPRYARARRKEGEHCASARSRQNAGHDMAGMDHSTMNHGDGMNEAGMYLMTMSSGTSMNPRAGRCQCSCQSLAPGT